MRGDQRRMVPANLAGCSAPTPVRRRVLDRWASRSFQAYARYWVEGARLAGTPAAEVEERTVVQGFEHLEVGWQPEKA